MYRGRLAEKNIPCKIPAGNSVNKQLRMDKILSGAVISDQITINIYYFDYSELITENDKKMNDNGYFVFRLFNCDS